MDYGFKRPLNTKSRTVDTQIVTSGITPFAISIEIMISLSDLVLCF